MVSSIVNTLVITRTKYQYRNYLVKPSNARP